MGIMQIAENLYSWLKWIYNYSMGTGSVSGLAVICTHSDFMAANQGLERRSAATQDEIMMKNIWRSYGFETIEFRDKDVAFYGKDLITAIEKKFEHGKIKVFVFVLSTHGSNLEEQNIKSYRTSHEGKRMQHYFCTREGQFNTQDLIDRISTHDKMGDILKLFVIQSCRSLASPSKSQNEDKGFVIPVNVTTDSTRKGESLDKEYLPDDGCNLSDAKGLPQQFEEEFIPSPHKNREVPYKSATNIREKTEEESEYPNKDGISERDLLLIPTEPLCENSIVHFASMSGKSAYSNTRSGGWLIRSLYDTLNKYKADDKVDLFEVLVTVNRAVSRLNGEEISHDCWIEQTKETITEKIQTVIDEHTSTDKLKVHAEYWIADNIDIREEISELSEFVQVDTLEHTKTTYKEKTKDKLVRFKAQSCFIHNVVLEEDQLVIVRKTVINS